MVSTATMRRNLEIVSTTTGFQATFDTLNKYSSAHRQAAAATQLTTKESDQLDRALHRLRSTHDQAYRAATKFAAGEDILNRSLQVGKISMVEHGRQIDLLSAKYHTVDAAQTQAATGVGRLGGAMGGLKTFVGGFGIGLLTSELLQLPRAIGDVVGSTADLADAASKVGVTTTALQEMRYAGQLAGVEFRETDDALAQFARRTAQAANGTGPLVGILKANGVELRNTDGTLKSLDERLAIYADLMRGAASESEQLLLATEGFGRGGGAMVNVVGEGADAFARARQEAHDYGAVLDEDLVPAAARIDDQFDRLTMQVGTFFKGAILESVSAMDALIQRFNSLGEASGGELSRRMGEFQEERGAMLSHLELLRQTPTGPNGRLPEYQSGQIDAAQRRIAELDAQLAAIARLQAGATEGFRGVGSSGYAQSVTLAPTIIPNKADEAGERARAKSISDIERQREAVRNLIADLEHENRLIGMTATEREIENALRQAGAAATDKQRESIRFYITEMAAAEQAADRFKAQQDILFDIEQMHRGPFERGIQETMRQMGAIGDAGMESLVRYRAELDRTIGKLDEIRGETGDFVSGLLRGIRTGDVAGAFENLFEGVMGRLENRVGDLAAESMHGESGPPSGRIAVFLTSMEQSR